MNIQIKLTDNEFQKLSEETGVSQYDLQKLYSMGLVRDTVALDFLVRHDFKKIKRSDNYKTSQIVARLAMHYHVTPNRIKNAIYSKRMSLYYCEECGKLIRKSEYVRNSGICDSCVAKSITIP